jgi:hypothetical protein
VTEGEKRKVSSGSRVDVLEEKRWRALEKMRNEVRDGLTRRLTTVTEWNQIK